MAGSEAKTRKRAAKAAKKKQKARKDGRLLSDVLVTEIETLFESDCKQFLFHAKDHESKAVDHLRIPVWIALRDNPVFKKVGITDPNKKMRKIEGAILRCIHALPHKDGYEDHPERETQLQQSPPDLLDTLWQPQVGRRSPQSARLDTMQLRTNVPLAFNDYTDIAMKWFGDSKHCRENEDRARWFNAFIPEYNAARGWGEYFMPNRTADYRGRVQIDTGEFRGKQGHAFMKTVTHSKIAKRTDMDNPEVAAVVKFWLLKEHGFNIADYDKVTEYVANHNPYDKWSESYVDGYLKLRQIVETGESTALNGIDMIASVVLLITLIFGDLKAAIKFGVFEGGMPWLMKISDIWQSSTQEYRHKSKFLWGSGVKTADLIPGHELYPVIRKPVKTAGTSFSFGAGFETMGYQLAGLKVGRDDERLASGEKSEIKTVAQRMKYSPIYDKKMVGKSTQEQIDWFIKHAKKVMQPVLKRELPHVHSVSTACRDNVKNRVMEGENFRSAPLCALPTIEMPDGWIDVPVPFRRSHFNTHEVKSGSSSVWISDLMFSLTPELLTRLIHAVEAYIEAMGDRMWLDELGMNTGQGVFDASYKHFVDIPLFIRRMIPIFKQCLCEIRLSNPLHEFGEICGVNFPKPQFEIEDLPDDMLAYSA